MSIIQKLLPACIVLMGIMLPACSSTSREYFVKEVVFPENADEATKTEMASRLIPSDKQLAWQNLELTAFLHYGINTYTDREWGDRKESPE
ncbi:MAG: alpha-1,3/4-fucosidase, partial [Muribaculaceae bacterium]|nr:alpha-1,3/4-fucosidase [Muribaculaceae bacterium]